MWSQQIIVALLSLYLILQQTTAVVNNGQTQNADNPENSVTNSESNKDSSLSDSLAESSENSNRRDGTLSDSYGAPPASNIDLPVPVYGVPNAPSNNVVYPAAISDISPPPPPKPLQSPVYGAPPVNFLPQGPSSIKYGPPSIPNLFTPNHGPPKPLYGPPKLQYGPPKPVYGPPGKLIKFPKHQQKNNFGYKFPPKPIYGPPKFGHSNTNFFQGNKFKNNLYAGVSSLTHQYGAPVIGPPPKPIYGAPSVNYGPPQVAYGPPQVAYGPPQVAYGPPQPNPHPRPPHLDVPAPPTPPDIKYDGWQPILGAISKRPVEHLQQITGEGYNSDLLPPPVNQNQISDSYGPPPNINLDISNHHFSQQSSGLSDSYGVPLGAVTGGEAKHQGLSDSYQAPLNTVTGSGGIVASSGDEATNSHKGHLDINIDLSTIDQKGNLEQIKSEGFEIFTNGAAQSLDSVNQISNSYGPPPPESSENVYASAHSYNNFNLNHKSQKQFSANTIGLTPPSGSYGQPPSGSYGPPPSRQYGPPHRRRPQHNFGHSNTYLSPPSAELSGVGSLPHSNIPISSQSFVQGSSTAGLKIEGVNALPLSSYNVPLGAIDGSYSLPNGGLSVGLDLSHPPVSIDLTQGKSFNSNYDCNKQQQQLPSLAYGVPSVDSYTSSLSSLTTNIGTSQAQTIVPHATYGIPQGTSGEYGVPDLSHSSSIKTESKVNSVGVDTHGKSYGKSVAESFGPNSDLIESQSIDLSNIPLQGNLGSYTLQIQSSDGTAGQVPHGQVLNEGLLQSILQAIEQPGQSSEVNGIPIIHEQKSYTANGTHYVPAQSIFFDSQSQGSQIHEVKAIAPLSNELDEKIDSTADEDTLQLLDSSPIALYYKKADVAEDKADDVFEKIEDDDENKESDS